MRIGYVLDALALGGTERQFCLLAEGISQHGQDVHLLSLSEPARETERMIRSLNAMGVRFYVSSPASRISAIWPSPSTVAAETPGIAP